MNRERWPNLLSATRIALMPAVLASAMAGSRFWFVVLIAVSLTTDGLDGFLARRFNAFTEFGRTLDSYADYAVLLTGIAGIALLWPELIRRELPWVMMGLGAFFLVITYGYARFGRALRYHTLAVKVLAPALGCSLIPLLSELTAIPFRVLIVLQVLAAIEQLAIAIVLPSFSGEIPSFLHALRIRRETAAKRDRVGESRKDQIFSESGGDSGKQDEP